ncbi:Alpha/Beta hydrolase protein [Russula compacta]|nr:Alpha/Beta hydrolase protein [Russula compacta]
MSDFLDIPYTAAPLHPHPLRTFDLFVPRQNLGNCGVAAAAAPATPQPPPPPLICFVHGGAWRSEDKRDHSALARSLAACTSCAVAVPNYRLTGPDDQLRHPAHAHDILQSLTFLLSWPGPQGSQYPPYDPNRIFLIGHSCSAHMLVSILLDSSEPALVPPVALLRAVRGVVFSEGIYDIDTLLRSFPAYRNWFICDAFGDLPTYDRYSVTKMTLREGAKHIYWFIVHSKGDSLVDSLQSQAMYDHLQSIHEWGLQGASQVLKSWDDLEDEHNAILQSAKYFKIVENFIHIVSNA